MTELRSEAEQSEEEAPERSGTAERTAEELAAEVGRRSMWARYAFMPAVLLVVVLLLFAYLSVIELDTIEQRALSWPRVRTFLLQHIQLSAYATAGIIVIAVPLGVVLTRSWASRFTPVAVNFANAGQAIPSLGVLALLFVLFRPAGVDNFQIAVAALIIYGILPVLRNTLVGILQIDPFEIEAARGMGLRQRQVLWQVELPLAVPVILAGIRVSLILCVGTAALAVFIGAGGLGVIIQNGISMTRLPVLVTGATITAVLALFVDWIAGVVEDLLRPKGL